MSETLTQGTEQKVDEQTKDPEPEKKQQTNDEGEPPGMTNDTVETDPVRKVVNKKLSTMSKESKEGKKNRKRVLKPPKDEVKLPDRNPMYLLTFIGLIIALVTLYYTRKTAMKEEEEEDIEQQEAREKVKEEAPQSEKPKESESKKQGIKGSDHMDPFYAQRHKNSSIFTFDD